MISPRLYNDVRIVNRPDLQNAWRLDRGALPMVMSMERTGICIDKTHLVNLNKKLTGEMEELQSLFNKLTGHVTPIGSGDKLAELLFDKMGLKQPGTKQKWTKKKTRLAVDGDVLGTMRFMHDAIPVALDWKEREKLRSTYTLSLIAQVDRDDRLHCDLNPFVTATGRLSSSNPNLQNIPVRTDLGTEIRKAFVPSRGNMIGTIDASQIEMRCHAHDSQCANMLDLFMRGEDLYWGTAELMFDRTFSKQERKEGITENGRSFKDEYRFPAKTTTLGVSYDITAEGLLDQIWIALSQSLKKHPELFKSESAKWDIPRCDQMIVKFFKAYWEMLERRKQHHRTAFRLGYVFDMFGGIRLIPQVKSSLEWVQREGLRAAGNMPIQGAAAGIIKLFMAVVWDRLVNYWHKYGIRALMQIHDELLFEGPESPLRDFLLECQSILFNLIPMEYFLAPLESGTDIAESWGHIKK